MPKRPTKVSARVHRPAVPAAIKRTLYAEAGNKCANPGCPNRLLELHHIQEWHVYQSHNAKHMIALCPTCHAFAHHGELLIDETTIRSWKSIHRDRSRYGHFYIEPGPSPRLILGSLCIERIGGDGLVVFDLSAQNRLSFRLLQGGVLLVSATITGPDGTELITVRENHLSHALADGIEYRSRPGHHRITAPADARFLPQTVLDWWATNETPFPLSNNGRLVLFDLQALDRATVRVEGIWASPDRNIIIKDQHVAISMGKNYLYFRGYREGLGEAETLDLKDMPLFRHEGNVDRSLIDSIVKSQIGQPPK